MIVYLEYVVMIGLFLFCVGTIGILFFLSGAAGDRGPVSRHWSRYGRYCPLLAIGGIGVSLIGFFLYWRRSQGVAGFVVLILIGGVAWGILRFGMGEERRRV